MRFLKKIENESECAVGDKCLVLADFSGVPAGCRGIITEIYKEGVMVEWDLPETNPPLDIYPSRRLRDGFARDELKYLAFETK